jgi:hypothetical protein
MAREQEAFNDLVATLKAIPWLSVYTEKGKAGARQWSLEISRGTTVIVPMIGCRKIMNGYDLVLMTNGTTAPADLSEKINIIDSKITKDRRRGGAAQTTVMDDAGWTPDEDLGREKFSISTSLDIQIKEVR